MPTFTKVSLDASREITDLTAELQNLLRSWEQDDALEVVVVEVHGGGEVSPGLALPSLNRWEKTLRRFERLPFVTATYLSADISAFGSDLFFAGSLRFVRQDTTLALPAVNGSLLPTMTVHRLVRDHGTGVARDLLLKGAQVITARTLVESGVASWAGDLGDVLSQLEGLYSARAGLSSYAVVRNLIEDATVLSYEELLGASLAATDKALRANRA